MMTALRDALCGFEKLSVEKVLYRKRRIYFLDGRAVYFLLAPSPHQLELAS